MLKMIIIGSHRLVADEPIAQGGNDTGPSPYELLLAALGACTSMTLRMYAEVKKIPLEKVIVRLRHEKIHAQDCKECESRDSKMDHVERMIELKGDLSFEERSKLLEIANKCHQTLTSKISITTSLID